MKVVLDENNTPLIRDLSMINNKGEFVEEKDCFLNGKPYIRKQQLCRAKEFIAKGEEHKQSESYFLSDWYFSSSLTNKPIKELSKELLLRVITELELLAPEKLQLKDKV